MDNYHVTKRPGGLLTTGWRFFKAGSSQDIAVAETKAVVLVKAVEYMNQHPGSLKIHREDGTIEEERTYPRSADPRGTPG